MNTIFGTSSHAIRPKDQWPTCFKQHPSKLSGVRTVNVVSLTCLLLSVRRMPCHWTTIPKSLNSLCTHESTRAILPCDFLHKIVACSFWNPVVDHPIVSSNLSLLFRKSVYRFINSCNMNALVCFVWHACVLYQQYYCAVGTSIFCGPLGYKIAPD